MKQRKYTLPRHTILAKQSSRIGAFLVDLAIFVACIAAFFFGCFRLILNPVARPYVIELEQEQINSHLCFRNDETGRVDVLSLQASYDEYRDSLSYYYMNYLTGNVSEPGTGSKLADEPIVNENGEKVSKTEYYTISWFNKYILRITVDDPDNQKNLLFTYQKNSDGSYDKTKIGVPKSYSEVSELEVKQYLQQATVDAYTNNFLKMDYVIDLYDKSNFIFSLELVLSAVVGAVITYVVFPLIFKQGRTVGKKVFKLALASSDGYIFLNRQLGMRVMPLLVVLLAFLIPIWVDSFVLVVIPLTIFLVSFALAMASPKKSSLHDFTARTIVIDDKASIIFNDEFEEEEFTLREDGLTPEEHREDENGEEPEISYEKYNK